MSNRSLSSRRLFIITFVIILVTVACSVGAVPAVPTTPPTPIPIPILPTEISLPTISLDTEVIIPELQFTKIPPGSIEDESIWIQSPAPGEKINDEIFVRGISNPTFEQNLGIRLVGENGSELFRGNTIIQAEAGARGEFSETIDISGTPIQPAILQVFSVSPKDGSLIHLSSVVVQINSGIRSSASTNSTRERIYISSVTKPSSSANHSVFITGKAWGSFENTLNYAVCGESSGNSPDFICGSMENRLIEGVLITDAVEMGLPGDYEISLTNTNTFPPSATIVVYSDSPMNGAIDHAASHNVFQQ